MEIFSLPFSVWMIMIILIQFIILLFAILTIRHLSDKNLHLSDENLHLSDENLHLSDEKVLNRALNEPLTLCSPEVDFRDLLAKVDRLVSDDAVDLDTICEHLLPGEGNSKTDRYALDGDLEDPSEGESKSRPNESKTNGKNGFSRFRRKMGNLVVKRWQPNEDMLYDIVCEKLFNGSVTMLDDFIREASEVRNRCLKLLRFRKSQEEEMVVQCVFIRFLATILGPMQHWAVLPVNNFQLSASVQVDGSPPSVSASRRTLNGFADVGIFEHNVNEPSKQFLVVGEMKASLLELNTYRQKDQLLIEMEGVRQGWASDAEAHHPFVRGFLTDMITINIAIADNRHDKPVFYVAKRGWSHRSFLIRLLFLLCGDLPDETWKALSVETPLSVGCKAGPTTRSQTQGSQAGKTHSRGGRGDIRQRGGAAGTGRTAPTRIRAAKQEKEIVINFKEEEEMELYEKQMHTMLVNALRLQGHNYLCGDHLAQIASVDVEEGAEDNNRMRPSIAMWIGKR